MEQLSLLEKIYLYGETLSSEEMNLLVSYINVIIEALNSLIRNNNGINSGHCVSRYILSPTQPEKPATGTNGLSNGWSNLYLLPEVGSGNSTWMSFCLVSGEDVYGEWSEPICISSGTITGLQGPKGDSGEIGAFVSRIFKRQNVKPDTPVGGTYANPVPDGWYDGVPEGTAIIWSSSATFYGNGTHTNWSEPAQESDTDTLDIEFSPNATQPPAPLGNVPFTNHESEGWYDPSSANFSSAGTMIWRAERKVSNGEYNGDWTITRIFGEKGDKGTTGDTGGHYEFRYINFKSTLEQAAPTKPAEGTDGTSGGWGRNLQALTEIEIKEGMFTWMTQCYLDENNVYGVWTDPIRITGANGIDGEDGTEQEFMYTRNNTGVTPATPPHTLKNEAALFGDLGYWIDPNSGVKWTDDPLGVNDEIMWEFVTTRVKEGTIWGPFSTPVVWAKWGKQGKIGQMSYLAGVWDANTTYVKTAERNPIVYWNNNYYYLIGELTFEGPNKHITEITSQGQNPTSNPSVWAQAENYEMVFTDILFVLEFAKLASFIVNRDWMFSQHGVLYDANGGAHDIDDNNSWNGHTANDAYIYFKPDAPNGNKNGELNFVPAFAIDALSGRCFFWKGYFKGAVVADTLTLGSGVTIAQDRVDNLINSLASKLGYSVGSNFSVNGSNGQLVARNAWIEGFIAATSGYFVGDVRATQFIAGNEGGLNITTTGDAISFNYGGERRAWFTTKDESGNDTNGMYLYIKNPNGGIITIDFANLLFKNANVTGTAVLLTNFFSSITTSNYIPNIFISSSNGLYYQDSQLNFPLNGSYYRRDKTGLVLIEDGSNYRLCNTDFYRYVTVSNGTITNTSSGYYASTSHYTSGQIKEIKSLGGTDNPPTNKVYMGEGSTTMSSLNLTFDSVSKYYAVIGSGSGGNLVTIINGFGTLFTAGENMTLI